MPTYLIHHAGAWNEYTTVADGACWERAMTLDQLEAHRRQDYSYDRQHFGLRVSRALAKGCSAIEDITLDDCIAGNRAGENESRLTREEFIARYLTLGLDAAPRPRPPILVTHPAPPSPLGMRSQRLILDWLATQPQRLQDLLPGVFSLEQYIAQVGLAHAQLGRYLLLAGLGAPVAQYLNGVMLFHAGKCNTQIC